MTRDSLIINANRGFALPEGDGDIHIVGNPNSMDGNMTEFECIQDNNLSYTEIKPPLIDVVANNEGKFDDHVEYIRQITHYVPEYQNFTDTARLVDHNSLVTNANQDIVQPQEDNLVSHFPGNSTSRNGINVIEFEPIQDINLCPSYTETEPPLMNVVAAANPIFVLPQGDGDDHIHSFPQLMDVSANNEGKLDDLVEYNGQKTPSVLYEYLNFTDMNGLATIHNFPKKRTRDSVIINANPTFYP
ncbi:hypothetical protein M5689_003141 [Euphorbia peplus]|nr:hypothetical protein M5689_003141 [Euphorbia peplus]